MNRSGDSWLDVDTHLLDPMVRKWLLESPSTETVITYCSAYRGYGWGSTARSILTAGIINIGSITTTFIMRRLT